MGTIASGVVVAAIWFVAGIMWGFYLSRRKLNNKVISEYRAIISSYDRLEKSAYSFVVAQEVTIQADIAKKRLHGELIKAALERTNNTKLN